MERKFFESKSHGRVVDCDYKEISQDFGIHCWIDLKECVEAIDKYDQLPPATIQSLITSCQNAKVNLSFVKYRGKLILTGIFRPTRGTMLYPNGGEAYDEYSRKAKLRENRWVGDAYWHADGNIKWYRYENK